MIMNWRSFKIKAAGLFLPLMTREFQLETFANQFVLTAALHSPSYNIFTLKCGTKYFKYDFLVLAGAL